MIVRALSVITFCIIHRLHDERNSRRVISASVETRGREVHSVSPPTRYRMPRKVQARMDLLQQEFVPYGPTLSLDFADRAKSGGVPPLTT